VRREDPVDFTDEGGESMSCRKWSVVLAVAVSCAGCVTETKSVTVSSNDVAKFKDVKETEYPKRDPQPLTYVSMGQCKEANASDPKLQPVQQEQLRDDARRAYQKAIDLNPKCIEAHVALANWHLKQEDYDRALAVYQKAVKTNPSAPTLWYEQGVIYCQRKDFTNALLCLGKAHQLDPQDRHVATQYGLCLARAGKPQEAVTILCKVMNKADANYDVARMMNHLQQPDLCRQYLTAALQERPTHLPAQQLLAQLNGSAGPQAPAMAPQAPAMARSLSLDPNLRPSAN
jgi:Flp pilus assembly protein TadD